VWEEYKQKEATATHLRFLAGMAEGETSRPDRLSLGVNFV
jgi:hypothetical protein